MSGDISGCGYGSPEADQILVPTSAGLRVYPLTQIFGLGKRTLRAAEGMGLAPLHFITQRGPLQDGETVLDMRYDVRTIQILLAETMSGRTSFWDRKWDWLDLLRPNRSFSGGAVTPLVYRKWLPGGKIERGTDLETTAGDDEVTSHSGRFVERGLTAGQSFIITSGADANTYTIVSVPNDYTVQLDTAMGATATNVHWQYTRGRGIRDLNCLLAQGLDFPMSASGDPYYPSGYREALRFTAHDPFWYGVEQYETWAIPDNIGDLVFDGAGAWFGKTSGVGRWLFAISSVGERVNTVYWGTVGAKPVITVTGPATNIVISNDTIGITIRMNYAIAMGETVTIDTLNITATNNLGANLLPYTSGDIASFMLSPPPQAPDRINQIIVSFDGADVGSNATMLWRNRYVGLQ